MENISRRALLLLILVILLGTTLRVVTLSHESVDGDELFSRRVALLPMRLAYQAIRDDLVHPPLYYFLPKAGISVGGAGAIGIRLWSLLFGMAAIASMAAAGTELPGTSYTGILGAAMLAVNKDFIYYSQQARSYSLYVFLAGFLVLWVSAVTRRRERPQRNWLWMAGCLLMVVLSTHTT